MADKIRELIGKFDVRRFVRYGLVGVANTLVDVAVFYLLNSFLGMGMVPAQIISFLAGTLNSYMLNRRWTFGKKGGTDGGEILRFCAGKTGYLLLSLALMELLTRGLSLPDFAAKLVTTAILLFFNYLYDKIVVFVKNK